ncbi:MAG: hypothetical protein LKI03_06390 [Acetobacter indonesiensis]|jgi:hypothetical protein|nr:hypothetical protein [Acetobacter indonesiensis]MCI1546215.1 hypothetical protein [Acetobacter indonesiensis]MCI1765660.1 hypothetical protein [Acetobacter indonesiensis]
MQTEQAAQAQRDRLEREAKAAIAREQAAAQAMKEAKARAVQAERDRLAEEKRREEVEAKRRAADKAHKSAVNNAALLAIVDAGASESLRTSNTYRLLIKAADQVRTAGKHMARAIFRGVRVVSDRMAQKASRDIHIQKKRPLSRRRYPEPHGPSQLSPSE